jgi:hypothetical protein
VTSFKNTLLVDCVEKNPWSSIWNSNFINKNEFRIKVLNADDHKKLSRKVW